MKRQTENTTEEGKSDAFTHSSDGVEALAEERTPEGVTLTQLRAENEQLKAAIRLDAAHRQITGELTVAGARSPGLLFDSIKGDLQIAEDGKVENAAVLVGRLKNSFPEQFGFEPPAASIDAGAGVGAAPRLTRETLAKMKTEEIAALDWADVKRVLASG